VDWQRDGSTWPHRECSQFVQVSNLRWHVQKMPGNPYLPKTSLPDLLLIHGTGASTHSWRALMPLLSPKYKVWAVDLPGHGFTSAGTAQQMSLPGMAQALAALLEALGVQPQVLVGHSAGAAIAARLCLDGWLAPQSLFSLNGALLPLGGLPGLMFPPAAKLMAALPFVPKLFALSAANPQAASRLIAGTGSVLDDEGTALYARLLRSSNHAAGALAMMANWDLKALEIKLPELKPALTLVVGTNDQAVPPSQANRVHRMLPKSKLITLSGLGHLAHEEQAQTVAGLLTS
jgi:magnesium chelatase accessory protein